MAYEVVKTIGGRQYRYRVQSERDAQSGKLRNRWTYLGRVASEPGVAKARAARPNARLRLLEAVEALLASGDASVLTVDAIVAAAGVAHGTFYRYFQDRSAALEELARHIRATRGIGDDRLLRDDVAGLDEARTGVRRWIVDKLRYARERRASLRAWHALIASDARLTAFREERREAAFTRLRDHIEVLNARSFASVADPASTAAALIALYDGIVRTSILERDRLADAEIDAAADIVERALFARVELFDGPTFAAAPGLSQSHDQRDER
jgi:AcrR family transcriptional regulator